MSEDKKLVFVDIINMLLSLTNDLKKEQMITYEERVAISKYLGMVKQVLITDEFRVIYKAFNNNKIRILN